MSNVNKCFKEGYQFYCDSIGAAYSTGTNVHVLDNQFEYVFCQQEQIDKLISEINHITDTYRNNPEGSRQGFLFEAFQRKTYDYNRIVNHQGHVPEAQQPAMSGYASPDAVVDGVEYNAKVYADAHKTFRDAIAVTHRSEYNKLKSPISEEQFKSERGIKGSLDKLKQEGKKHLVVSDQKDDIIRDAKSAARASVNKGTVKGENYREIARDTVDHIEDQYGNQSIPISKISLEELDRQAINKQISPETLKAFGIDPSTTISWEQLRQQMIQQCLKTGTSAALIAAVLNAVPVIINAISLLIEEGELDSDFFCRLGYQSLSAPAKGFLIGCSTSAIINSTNYIRLNEVAKGATNIRPLTGLQSSMIALAVSVLICTVEIAIQKALGKINRAEMADRIFDCCLTSTLSIIGGLVSQNIMTSLVSAANQEAINALFTSLVSKVFGTAFTAAFPAFNILAYLIGSAVGFAIAKIAHYGAKRMILSFCVESGCTFFGLVDQNYELPQEILDEIGIDVFEYEKFDYESFKYDCFQFDSFTPGVFEYDKFGITIIRRGVIGVGKIGYQY